MHRTRHLALVVYVVALAGATAGAFKLDYHDTITREAFTQLRRELPERVAQLLYPRGPNGQIRGPSLTPVGFTDLAIDEITAANKATDTDCGSDFRRSPDRSAAECSFGVETASAVAMLYLAAAPPADHFDDEKIEDASAQIYQKIGQIRAYLAEGRFVAARRALGSALHGLQDFYAHTNWVELNAGRAGIEERLGTVAGFGDATGRPGRPRLAGPKEPTCVGGERLLTSYPADVQQKIADGQPSGDAPTKAASGDDLTKEAFEKVFRDPPLTSGYFFFWGSLTSLKDDPADFTKWGKCRHGYQAGGIDQPGIHKDEPPRENFSAARQKAREHTILFVKALLSDATLAKRPDYDELILGLMGYEPTSVISSFSLLKFPPPPATQTMWDGILEVFLNIPAVHPDIVTCVSADDGRRICSDECANFDWQIPTKTCRLPLGPRGFRLPATGRILVEAWDIDPTTRQLMARGTIDVADPCVRLSPHEPCEIPAAGGPLVINFEAPGDETAAPSAPPGGPRPAPGPGGGSPAPGRVPPSAEAIDSALDLRDVDNCNGADQFMPQGNAFARSPVAQQLGPDQSNQLYQAVAFAMSVTDQATKQAVMSAIQSKVSDDAYYGAMTLVAGDLQQSRSVFAGYQSVAGALVGKVTTQGLDRLLPQPKTAAALVPDVDRWILKRLATPALVGDAVNMMFGGPNAISAECALNQLAKDGFTDTINGR